MAKSAEAFRSIGEVAKLIGVAPHVLRYWETQFDALKPMKRPDGRRYYRPPDLELAAGLCALLREDGMTIRGARKLIAADRGQAVRARGVLRLAPGTAPKPAPPVASWLVRLTRMARHLHQITPDDPRWPTARPTALQLGHAMLRLS